MSQKSFENVRRRSTRLGIRLDWWQCDRNGENRIESRIEQSSKLTKLDETTRGFYSYGSLPQEARYRT